MKNIAGPELTDCMISSRGFATALPALSGGSPFTTTHSSINLGHLGQAEGACPAKEQPPCDAFDVAVCFVIEDLKPPLPTATVVTWSRHGTREHGCLSCTRHILPVQCIVTPRRGEAWALCPDSADGDPHGHR